MDYTIPDTIGEAVRIRSETGFAFLAGGTDLYPAIEHGARPAGLIDLSRIGALRGPVRVEDGYCVLPALTTWETVCLTDLPPLFDALKAAAREIGGRQIQNAGTIGGNLCNASPAADGNAVLLALDASVRLAGTAGVRELPLSAFLLGNRRTDLRADELLESVRVPLLHGRHGSAFRKLGARHYLVISIAMAGVVLEVDTAGNLSVVRATAGACGERPVRLHALERRLDGLPVSRLGSLVVREDELVELAPIDDVRGTAAYRVAAVCRLLESAIGHLARELSA